MRKRGWGKTWLAVSMPFVFLIAAVSTARADVSAGGQRLVNIQNDDGTWDFEVTGKTAGGPSGGEGSEGLTGVTGLGLLAAFEKTSNSGFRDAAVLAGDHLVEVFNADEAAVPFPQDIEFLMALSQASGLSQGDRNTFRDTARSWFRNTTREFSTAKKLIDHFVGVRAAQNRKALALWDVASVIRAAVAAGDFRLTETFIDSRGRTRTRRLNIRNKSYARSLASRAVTRSVSLQVGEDTEPGDNGLGTDNVFSFQDTLLSRGSLLLSLTEVRGSSSKVRRGYRTFLEDNQETTDGSWSQGHTQITSYAVLGLKAGGGGGVSEGTNFLTSHQLGNGGFPAFVLTQVEIDAGFTTQEISEFDSEAVQAMSLGGASKSAAAKDADDASSPPVAGVRLFTPAEPARPIR